MFINMGMTKNNGINNFSLVDFKCADHGGFYILTKPCIIFDKEVVKPSITLKSDFNYPENGYEINEKVLIIISEYIKWINNYENGLLKYFYDTYKKIFNKNSKTKIEEITKEKWFEDFFIEDIEISIEYDGSFTSEITCKKLEDKDYLLLEIKTKDYSILSMDILDK
jgi:hypothetical protein